MKFSAFKCDVLVDERARALAAIEAGRRLTAALAHHATTGHCDIGAQLSRALHADEAVRVVARVAGGDNRALQVAVALGAAGQVDARRVTNATVLLDIGASDGAAALAALDGRHAIVAERRIVLHLERADNLTITLRADEASGVILETIDSGGGARDVETALAALAIARRGVGVRGERTRTTLRVVFQIANDTVNVAIGRATMTSRRRRCCRAGGLGRGGRVGSDRLGRHDRRGVSGGLLWRRRNIVEAKVELRNARQALLTGRNRRTCRRRRRARAISTTRSIACAKAKVER